MTVWIQTWLACDCAAWAHHTGLLLKIYSDALSTVSRVRGAPIHEDNEECTEFDGMDTQQAADSAPESSGEIEGARFTHKPP